MSPDTHAGAQACSDLSHAAVRAQLERILTSDIFSRSQQLRRFLSFIVEQQLAGQSHAIKESVLAHELYGKGTDFDSGNDPVVRVDARRLRDKLREYYVGRPDPLVISLPKGSYVPLFEVNGASPADRPLPVVAPEVTATVRVPDSRRARIAAAIIGVVGVLVVTGAAWRALRGPAHGPVELLPLASYPGSEGPPALSPDGSLVAFAWSGAAESGATDIYVKAVGSEALRQLTATPDSEGGPAWSPDGRSVAFARAGQGVFTMSQLGGAERQISRSGTHVGWAGDGKSVLIRDRESDNSPFGIHQVFLDTLERRRLTQAPVGAGDWTFAVSPDGRTLAFIRYEKRGIADVHVVPMSGGEPRRLSNWNATINGLSWTPDGREIVYSVNEPAASRLWRIQVNGSAPGRGSPIADVPVAADNPSISRPMSGRPVRLAFQTITRDVDLRLMDLESRPVNGTLDSHPFANSTRIEGSARFSPDGGRIAFTSFRSGAQEIWVAERDGSGLRQVTALGAAGVLVGEWSPDGSQIVFEAAVAGNTDVYLVGTDGGHLRRLTTEPSIDGVPTWSRDGRWIHFASTRAGAIPDIWRVSPDGRDPIRETHGGGFQPQESPDGRFIFYLDRHPGAVMREGRLMRVPVGGGQPERVLEHVWPFLWAVTDAGIVFVSREQNLDAIDTYRLSDRRVTRLARLGFRVPGTYTHMAASRDGRWAVATKMERFDADLMLLDNFR